MENYNNKSLEELRKRQEELVAEYDSLNQSIKDREEAEAKAKAKKLADAKAARKKEVDEAIEKANDLLKKWWKDYGKYEVDGKDGFDIFWPHNFFF